MDNEQSPSSHLSPFEATRRENKDGFDYWSARELSKLLGYTEYRKFKNAIKKAEEACAKSGQVVSDHFAHLGGMVSIGSGAKRKVDDVYLSRYACYLLVQNADSSKPIVALGQTYFTIQTRRQELTDEFAGMPEAQLRIIRRSQMSVLNTQLAEVAQQAGVIEARDFAIFHDHGYMGLYGGLKARDIHMHKGLTKKSQDILDYMGSDELAANAFRASLTRQKIYRERIQGKEKANRAHYDMGKLVRSTIKEAGATLPENLPTPEKSIQQVQRDELLRIRREQQLSLF